MKTNEENEAAHLEYEEAELKIQYEVLRLELEEKKLEICSGGSEHPCRLTRSDQGPVRSPPRSSQARLHRSHPLGLPSLRSLKDALLAAVNEPQDLASLMIFNKMSDTKIFVARRGQTRLTLRPCRDIFAFSEQE